MNTSHRSQNCKDKFPLLYHAHHSDYLDDLPFWLDLAKAQPGPTLELGCGTGRVLIPMAKAGNRVIGIDIDQGMLEILKESIPASLESLITIIQADLSAFRFTQQFSLIILPCNTYSTLDRQTRIKMLRCVRQHLKTEGLFAASIPNPNLLAGLESSDEPEIESIFQHPITAHPVQVSCDWERSADQFTLNWHYDHLLPDGQVERLTTSVGHFLTSAEEYQTEIINAGLSIQAVYGDFDRSTHTLISPNFIVLARKFQ